MGTAAIGFLPPGESIQRNQRDYTEEWTDNHGRRFGAWYDTRTMRPIGELAPADGWTPPWLPPQRFIRWKSRMGFAFSWDYDTMAAELAGQTAEYYADVTKFMVEHMPASEPPKIGQPVNSRVRQVLGVPPLSPALPLAAKKGNAWLLGKPGAKLEPTLRQLIVQSIGVNGREAIEAIEEQLEGIIGDDAMPAIAPRPDEDDRVGKKKGRSIDDVDESKVLAAIDTMGYREFLAESMKAGLKMTEAADLWHRHKAALAEVG
jgi:hypothetical protein